MSDTTTTTDVTLRTLVQDELDWSPDVDAARVGVSVDDGTVALSGEVDDYAERLAAKRAALRVRGVRAVVDNLTVHPKTPWPVTDVDIAKEVDRALRAATNVPDTVKATVDDHVVTLTGEVTWDYQRRAAQNAVQYLRGVHSVANLVALTRRVSAADTAERIRSAIVRNAQLDARTIEVSANGGKVTLTGTVGSWAEKQQAGNAAWASPHVTDVDNRILVRSY